MEHFDSLDKHLSSPLFHAKVPLLVECIWSIPGNFFGNPLFAMLVSPNLLSLYTSSNPSYFSILATVSLLMVMLILWFMGMQGYKTPLKIVFSVEIGIILAPVISISFLLTVHEREASKVGFFQIASWLAAEIPIIFLKPLIGRIRPVCCDEFRNRFKKHLSVLERLLGHDHRGSFPSGDAAGAMAILFPLLCGQNRGTTLSVIFLVLCCLGRIYWKAHHLSDVLVGSGLSFLCCRFLNQWVGGGTCQADLPQVVSAYFTFIIIGSIWRRYSKIKAYGSSISMKSYSSKRDSWKKKN